MRIYLTPSFHSFFFIVILNLIGRACIMRAQQNREKFSMKILTSEHKSILIQISISLIVL